MLQCTDAVKCGPNEAPYDFGATHMDDTTLTTSMNADTVLVLRGGKRYLTNPDGSKEKFSVYACCKGWAQYVRALQALFSEVRHHNLLLLDSSWFDGFMDSEITLSKSSTIKIKISDLVANGKRLFQ